MLISYNSAVSPSDGRVPSQSSPKHMAQNTTHKTTHNTDNLL
jgi:hypothetical protein